MAGDLSQHSAAGDSRYLCGVGRGNLDGHRNGVSIVGTGVVSLSQTPPSDVVGSGGRQ